MDSIRKLRIKHEDGSYSNSIPIGASSNDIFMTSGGTLTDSMSDVEEAIIALDKTNDTQIESIDELIKSVSSNTIAIQNQKSVNERQEIKMENFEKALAQEKVYVFDNVYAMKNANNLKAGMYCITKGYYTPNDGGGAKYNIVSTKLKTDYVEILNNDKYAQLIHNGCVNVMQYGVSEENSDNYSKLNAILNDLTIRNVFINKGIYYISHGIKISNNNLTIKSNGATIKTDSYKLTDGSPYIFWIANIHDIKIDGLVFDTAADLQGVAPSGHTYQNYDNFSNRCGIQIFNSYNVILNNLQFKNFENDIFTSAFSTDLGRNKNNNIKISNIKSYLSPMPMVFNYTSNVLIENYYAETKPETGFGNHDVYCSQYCNDITIKNVKFINDYYFGCAFNILNSQIKTFDARNYNINIENLSGQISEIISYNETDLNVNNVNVSINNINEGDSHRYLIRIYDYEDENENINQSQAYFNNIHVNNGFQSIGITGSKRSTNTINTPIHYTTINDFSYTSVGMDYAFTLSGQLLCELIIKNSNFDLINVLDGFNSILSIINCLFISAVRTYFIAIRTTTSVLNLINNNFIATDLSMTQAIYNPNNSISINGWGNNCYNINKYISISSGIDKNNSIY